MDGTGKAGTATGGSRWCETKQQTRPEDEGNNTAGQRRTTEEGGGDDEGPTGDDDITGTGRGLPAEQWDGRSRGTGPMGGDRDRSDEGCGSRGYKKDGGARGFRGHRGSRSIH